MLTSRGDEEGLCPINRLNPNFQEKLREETLWCPYRKPTQVGKVRNLRRLRELWLRNSANFIRNFGRRMALVSEGISTWSTLGLQIPGGSDCLPKT